MVRCTIGHRHPLWDAVTSARVELTDGEETPSSLQSPLRVRAMLTRDDPLFQGQKLSGTVQRWENGTFLFTLFYIFHSDTVGHGCAAPRGRCGAVPRPVWQRLWLLVPSGMKGNELQTNASP